MGLLDVQASEAEEERVALGHAGPFISSPTSSPDQALPHTSGLLSGSPRCSPPTSKHVQAPDTSAKNTASSPSFSCSKIVDDSPAFEG